MKAISLRQPWPWFILHAGKNLENRSWTMPYRGPVLIHSSKWWDEEEIEDDLDTAASIASMNGTMPTCGRPPLSSLRKELGHIVGMATIVDATTESESLWFFGPKAFVLENPVAFPGPVPCRGERGIFTVSDEVAEACRIQIDLVRAKA